MAPWAASTPKLKHAQQPAHAGLDCRGRRRAAAVWTKQPWAAPFYLAADPARPLQTLAMPVPFARFWKKQFTQAERNNILSYGGATTVVDAGGNVLIDRAVTNFVTNSGGFVDPSYRDTETMYAPGLPALLGAGARIAQKFPALQAGRRRHAVCPRPSRGHAKIIRAGLIALFMDWEDAGLVEDVDQFKADLLVQRNGTDVNRVDVLLPPTSSTNSACSPAQIQFRL